MGLSCGARSSEWKYVCITRKIDALSIWTYSGNRCRGSWRCVPAVEGALVLMLVVGLWLAWTN
jgi:hypothetical protein